MSRATVIHTYRNRCTTVAQPPGFADFLRGTIALHQYGQDLAFDMQVDFAHHPIGNFLERGPAVDAPDGDTVSEFFNENQPLLVPFLAALEPDRKYLVTAHNFPPRPIDEHDRSFAKILLTPKADYQRELSAAADELRLPPVYAVIHVRTGDRCATFKNRPVDAPVEAHDAEGLASRLHTTVAEQIVPRWGENVLVLSDNKLVSQAVARRHQLKALAGEPVHLGWAATSASVQHTLSEFFLMTRASEIYQWSTYGNSGFSQMAGSLFEIPLRNFPWP